MKIKEDFMLRNIAGDWIVVPMGERLAEFNGMIKLNESGAFIWKLLETGAARDEIIATMLKEYDVDAETASAEADMFLEKLTEAHILEAD